MSEPRIGRRAYIHNPVRALHELGMPTTSTPTEDAMAILRKQEPRKSSRKPRRSNKVKRRLTTRTI
jgi:hypothetical protein